MKQSGLWDVAPLVCHSILSGSSLGRIIETDYGLVPPVECILFNRGVNDVYLVSSNETRYMLRVSRVKRYGLFNEQAYRFEMDLLAFLHEKGIPVTHPLTRSDRDTIGVLNLPEGQRYYALFSYAEGDVALPMGQKQGYILGQILAQFHITADQFSSKHARFHLNVEYLIDEPMRRIGELSGISKDDMDFLEDLSNSLRALVRGLPKEASEYGIIHGDLWWNNVHFAGIKPTIFDFDYCGYGWRVCDVASLRGNTIIYRYPLSSNVMAAFLAGYQSIRKMTESELKAMPAFEKITVLWAFGLWTTGIDVLGTRWFYESFAKTLLNLKQWINEENKGR